MTKVSIRQGPDLVLRMGSHAEKEYIEKALGLLDRIIIGANLFEAAPGATSSLLVRLAGKKPPTLPYMLDPMTYAFGVYTDKTGIVQEKLDWIKSERKKGGTTYIDFKRSYKDLSGMLGEPFSTALQRGRAIVRADFPTAESVQAACRRTVEYQLARVKTALLDDPDYGEYAELAPPPQAVFAPYFYIDRSDIDGLVELCLQFAEITSGERPPGVSVHSILCADEALLKDERRIETIVPRLAASGIDCVWLWFSGFFEERADVKTLTAFKRLVQSLSQHLLVGNLHGGFFSLCLALDGLGATSHGIGYGEQKDVIPVIGQSTPTVRYYLPPVHKRLGVPQIERSFDALNIRDIGDFHAKVCDCVVCKGVVSTDLSDFSNFGDMHYSTPKSKRLAQTPAAAKRCRFHYLLRRFHERDHLRMATKEVILRELSRAHDEWSRSPTIGREISHLVRWAEVLED